MQFIIDDVTVVWDAVTDSEPADGFNISGNLTLTGVKIKLS